MALVKVALASEGRIWYDIEKCRNRGN